MLGKPPSGSLQVFSANSVLMHDSNANVITVIISVSEPTELTVLKYC